MNEGERRPTQHERRGGRLHAATTSPSLQQPSILLLGGALALLYDRHLRDRGGGRVGLDSLTGLLESCNALRLSVSRMGLPPLLGIFFIIIIILRTAAMNGLVRQTESRRLYTKAACGSQSVGWGSLMEECNCKRIDHDKIIKNNQIQDVQR